MNYSDSGLIQVLARSKEDDDSLKVKKSTMTTENNNVQGMPQYLDFKLNIHISFCFELLIKAFGSN